MSSLHPPSKLLLGCLASTDLGVGLVAQPLYVNVLLSPKHSKHCYYSGVLFHSTSCSLLCGIFDDTDRNKCGQTSRPNVGATVQTSGDFEENMGPCGYGLALQH